MKRVVSVLAVAVLTACSAMPSADVLQELPLGRFLPISATAVPLRVQPTRVPPPAGMSTAAAVRQRGMLRVGVRFDAPPLSSVNANGDLEGMDIDLAREMARRWLGSAQLVEFVQVTSVTAPEKVRDREVDLAMGGLVRTRDAEEDADFSIPYFEDGEAILTRVGAFKDARGLARQPVEYVDYSTLDALRTLQQTGAFTLTLLSNVSFPRAMQDVRNGRAIALAGNLRRLRLEADQDPQFAVLAIIQRDNAAIMLPENDSAWANAVNGMLSVLMSEGMLGTLSQKWMGVSLPATITPLAGPQMLQLADLPATRAPSQAFEKMRQRRTVRVAIVGDQDGFTGFDARRQAIGFEADLAREMARRWFGSEAAATFAFVPLADAPARMGTDFDLAARALPINFANELAFDMSIPTYVPLTTTLGISRLAQVRTPIGYGLPQNASDLRDLVNLTIQDMADDGVYARIFVRNFGVRAPFADLEVWRGTYSPQNALSTGAP